MTLKQKQALLAYLGYYDGTLDGLWGEKSQLATEAFQRDYQLTVDGIFGSATEKRMLEAIATGEEPAQQPQAAPETGEAADCWIFGTSPGRSSNASAVENIATATLLIST